MVKVKVGSELSGRCEQSLSYPDSYYIHRTPEWQVVLQLETIGNNEGQAYPITV